MRYILLVVISSVIIYGQNSPTNISLNSTSVNENESSGTTVGALSSTDDDTGDSHTYTLVSGSGSTHNSSFGISGSNLQTAASFNFESQSSYNILIHSTDSGTGTLYFGINWWL